MIINKRRSETMQKNNIRVTFFQRFVQRLLAQ